MKEIYNNNKEDDGFAYIFYGSEDTFGSNLLWNNERKKKPILINQFGFLFDITVYFKKSSFFFKKIGINSLWLWFNNISHFIPQTFVIIPLN